MTSAADYQARIETYGPAQLLQLWQAIKNRQTPGWPSGKALEYLVLRAFQLEDADVTYPYEIKVRDITIDYEKATDSKIIEQIDGVIYCDGLACLAEIKDQTEPVSIDPIAKLRNQLLRRHASTIGILFSRSDFTQPAAVLARYLGPQMVLLWGNDEISYGLAHQCMRSLLVEEYPACVEKGIPDFDARFEVRL